MLIPINYKFSGSRVVVLPTCNGVWPVIFLFSLRFLSPPLLLIMRGDLPVWAPEFLMFTFKSIAIFAIMFRWCYICPELPLWHFALNLKLVLSLSFSQICHLKYHPACSSLLWGWFLLTYRTIASFLSFIFDTTTTWLLILCRTCSWWVFWPNSFMPEISSNFFLSTFAENIIHVSFFLKFTCSTCFFLY